MYHLQQLRKLTFAHRQQYVDRWIAFLVYVSGLATRSANDVYVCITCSDHTYVHGARICFCLTTIQGIMLVGLLVGYSGSAPVRQVLRRTGTAAPSCIPLNGAYWALGLCC